jgi:hypothetical protein
MAAKKAEKA